MFLIELRRSNPASALLTTGPLLGLAWLGLRPSRTVPGDSQNRKPEEGGPRREKRVGSRHEANHSQYIDPVCPSHPPQVRDSLILDFLIECIVLCNSTRSRLPDLDPVLLLHTVLLGSRPSSNSPQRRGPSVAATAIHTTQQSIRLRHRDAGPGSTSASYYQFFSPSSQKGRSRHSQGLHAARNNQVRGTVPPKVALGVDVVVACTH